MRKLYKIVEHLSRANDAQEGSPVHSCAPCKDFRPMNIELFMYFRTAVTNKSTATMMVVVICIMTNLPTQCKEVPPGHPNISKLGSSHEIEMKGCTFQTLGAEVEDPDHPISSDIFGSQILGESWPG